MSNNEFLNNSNNLNQVIQRIFVALDLEGFGVSLQGIAHQELKNVNLHVLSNLEQISSSNSNLAILREAIIAAETNIDQIASRLEFSSDCTEVLLTGLPVDCSSDNHTIVFNFLNKIGAGSLHTS